MVHHRLEHTGRICQTEEHDQWLEQAIFRLEGSFFFISRLNSDVVIAPSYVELGEDMGVLDLAYEVRYKWQRIAIANGVLIQFSIVLYRLELSIFLLDKEEWRGIGGLRWSDVPLF